MKKYKHRQTNNIAIETNSEKNYKVSEPRNFTIPKWIIENSNDWEEVEQLCVPIGTKFTVKGDDTILTIKDDKVTVTWGNSEVNMCNIERANKNFANGTWIIYKEKDYEILEINYKSNNEDIIIKYLNGIAVKRSDNFLIENTCTLKDFIKTDWEKYITITKVKRVSDGEIFTIDDLCNPIGKYSYNQHVIAKIELSENDNLVFSSENWYIGLSSIEHSKKPILVTEDKVDIYEGDSYWFIWEKIEGLAIPTGQCLNTPYFVNKGTPCNKSSYWSPSAKFFSTKEAAEDYINLRKPCLSISEIAPIIGKCNESTYIDLDLLTKKLLETVKSKL